VAVGVSAEIVDRRLWAVFMLARDLWTCESILRRLPVRAGNLDGLVLRHAFRGAPLPPANDYIDVSHEMLDAIDEPGGFRVVRKAAR
jgi:hypothetical protein